MDTLAIIQKLKKKRPDLKSDPLFAELEAAQAAGEEEALVDDTSYLDDAEAGAAEAEAALPGEEEADAFIEDEAADEEEEALIDDTSYLDDEEEEEPILPVKRKLRR